MPSISVVIPLYNKEKHIKSCLKSVINQSIADIEVFVIDDGSTDDSANLVKEFNDDRIRLICTENKGVSAARNLGVKMATCELIAFLDADDEWEEDFLETILYLKSKYPTAKAIGTGYQLKLDDKFIKVEFSNLNFDFRDGIIKNYFKFSLDEPILSASSCALYKDILLEVGGFPEGVRYGEDVDTWCRIGLKYHMAFTSKVCATYNLDAQNRACKTETNYIYSFLKMNEDDISKLNIDADKLFYLREYIYVRKIRAALTYLSNEKYRKSVKALLDESKNTNIYIKKWFKAYMISFIPYNTLRVLIDIKNIIKRDHI